MRPALLTLLLLVACGEGPDDLFVVTGRTLSRDGTALEAVPVTATRSFGGDCNDGTRMRDTRSSDGGTFSFDFVRVEVQSLSGETSPCVRLQADFPSGAASWTNLHFFPNRLQLPDFSDWRADLSFEDGGVPHFTPAVTDLAPAICRGNFPDREVLVHGLVARADGGIAWEATDRVLRTDVNDAGGVQFTYSPAPLPLAPEVLEDFSVDVAAHAKRIGCVEVSGGGSLGTPGPYQVVTRWVSPGTVRLSGSLTPVSRGASCDGLPSPCVLTDGVPAAVVLPRPTNRFTLRLARATSIRAVVFRDALIEAAERPMEEMSVKNGSDALTVRFDGGTPELLDDIVFFGDDGVGRRSYRVVVLDRKVGPGDVVELELSRTFYRLGELSLFE